MAIQTPTFDPEIYISIASHQLIVYSIYYLHQTETEITPEDIISACFWLFPKKFSLKKYTQWPDSAMINRRWHDSRSKGYLAGSGIKLTAKGSSLAKRVAGMLGAKIPPKIKPPKPKKILPAAPKQSAPAPKNIPAPPVTTEAKIRAKKFVRMMEVSDAYQAYKKNGTNANINEFDFRSLLLCTMESSPETLAKNIEQFKGYAELHKRQDLIAFLTFCKDTFSYLFVPPKKITKKTK
jgi:hypothetical protein